MVKQIDFTKDQIDEICRLHCNDHPHHVISARVGDRLSYLEVIDLPRNTGQFSARKFRDGNPRSGIGNFLIACICHAPNKKCRHKKKIIQSFYLIKIGIQELKMFKKVKRLAVVVGLE